MGTGTEMSLQSKQNDITEKCDYVKFINCRGITPESLHISADVNDSGWQIGFFSADGEVYFKKVKLGNGARFYNLVRNYWQNGKEGSEKREGYYSLIKSVEVLEIKTEGEEGNKTGNQLAKDLADYIEGKYQVGDNWKLCELNRNMEVKIILRGYSLFLETAKRLREYFNKVFIDGIYTALQVENVIDQECGDRYIFGLSREEKPQKLVINAKLMGEWTLILFNQADDEVRIPEIIINKQGCFASIVRNNWQNNKEGDEKKHGYYSLVQHVRTLTIRNSPKVLKDFADYVVWRYEIGSSNWKLQQLSKDIKVVIEGPGDVFLSVSRIQNQFTDVAVDGRKPEEYLAAWGPWNNPDYKAFVNCFKAYGLIVDPPERCIDATRELVLEGCYDIRGPVDSIDSLTIRQKMGISCVVCFHNTSKPVVADKIVIQDGGDLRCVLQNAYYSNGQGSFFNLLKTAKRLEINNEQAAGDLVDYIDGKYALHHKWEKQALDKDMEIKLHHDSEAFSLDVARRLRNYFRNVSIDCVWTLLKTKNVIDQECEDKCVFTRSRQATPQNLVINAKLMGDGTLIQFNQADDEVHIPDIIINEQGCFAAIVHNAWQNNKKCNEQGHGFYSLVQHVQTLTFRDNSKAVNDFAEYVAGAYQISNSNWRIQKLSKEMEVNIWWQDGKQNDGLVKKLKNHFNHVHTRIYNRIQATNSINFNCGQYIFVGCREQKPRKLTINGESEMWPNPVFSDADGEVWIPEVTIERDGEFGSILYNMWENETGDEGRAGRYSLIQKVDVLTIRNNSNAVIQFAKYAMGTYLLAAKRSGWQIRKLPKTMRVVIENSCNRSDSGTAVKILAKHFDSVTVDGQRVEGPSDSKDNSSSSEDSSSVDMSRLQNRLQMLYKLLQLVGERRSTTSSTKQDKQLFGEDYVVEKKLGQGGFGKAYLVKSTTDGSRYVIKIITTPQNEMKQYDLQLAESEVIALMRCRCPYIVEYINHFVRKNRIHIVMRYCDGGDLASLLEKYQSSGQHLSQEAVLYYFTQLCLAVRQVHEKGIIHRDIKPQNIFLMKGDKDPSKMCVKLGDFGICKAQIIAATKQYAKTKKIGTEVYMAPEVLYGNREQNYNAKCDIWSLGCVLYNMCTFNYVNLNLMMIAKDKKPPSVLISTSYNQKMQDIIDATLQIDPEKRYDINRILDMPQVKAVIQQHGFQSNM